LGDVGEVDAAVGRDARPLGESALDRQRAREEQFELGARQDDGVAGRRRHVGGDGEERQGGEGGGGGDGASGIVGPGRASATAVQTNDSGGGSPQISLRQGPLVEEAGREEAAERIVVWRQYREELGSVGDDAQVNQHLGVLGIGQHVLPLRQNGRGGV